MYLLHCKNIKKREREREHANLYNIVKPAAYDRNINQYDLLSCKQKLNKWAFSLLDILFIQGV